MATYNITCRGRDGEEREVLKKPVNARVIIKHERGTGNMTMSVKCQHNCGYAGRECSASKNGTRKDGDKKFCPYTLKFPDHGDLLYHKLKKESLE